MPGVLTHEVHFVYASDVQKCLFFAQMFDIRAC